ncbi:conjugal transfer protein TraO [Aquimarina pacifica]|uniref:conjugal transfer protein TraO n=1 Tax=Aquimarina pacifica TaxID=1296415 RepID=UPI000470A2B9|nr:conjugal transfer protein TraO [Aquimarina pacifica]
MKKRLANTYLILAIIFATSFSVHAQSHKMAFSLTGGYVQNGFAGMVTVDYKKNEFDYFQFSLQGSFSDLENGDIDIPVSLYSLNAGYFYDLLRNNNRKYAIALGGGATVGYEVINEGDDVLENGDVLSENVEPSTAVFGVYFGLDADIFLKPTVAINFKANETYHFNSEVGDFTPYLGLGVKLILY